MHVHVPWYDANRRNKKQEKETRWETRNLPGFSGCVSRGMTFVLLAVYVVRLGERETGKAWEACVGVSSFCDWARVGRMGVDMSF